MQISSKERSGGIAQSIPHIPDSVHEYGRHARIGRFLYAFFNERFAFYGYRSL